MRVGKKIAFGFLALLFLGGADVRAQEKPLTIEETLRYMYYESPSIVAARHNLKGIEELDAQAKAGWLPSVNAETSVYHSKIDSSNFGVYDGTTTKSASVIAEQPLFRGFRTLAEIESARKRIEAGRRHVEEVEQETFLRTVEAYMNVIRDRMLLDLQRKNVSLLSGERDSVKARFDAGDVTKTDVQQTESRYSNAVADDAIAQAKMQASEAVFEQITGFSPPKDMVFPAPSFVFPVKPDDLVTMAAGQNPVLARVRDEHEAAESDIRAAKSDFYPQLSAYASHIKEYDPQPGIVEETEDTTVGLRARMSLYEGGKTLSRVREAKSRANQRFVEIRIAEQELRSKILSDWKRLQAMDAEITARQMEIAAAQSSARGVKEEARLGERTVLDTLEAEQDVLDAQTKLVQARRDRIVTTYNLAASLGLLVPERLGFGPEIPEKSAE